MRTGTRRFMPLALAAAVGLCLASALMLTACSASNEGPPATQDPIDLNQYLLDNTEKVDDKTRALPIDYTKVNEHPITGYMSYTLDGDRTVKMYIGNHATLRAYITVIALPNGVEDTYTFLKDNGWIDLADSQGEMIFVLEPKDGTWGTPEDEADYLDACLAEVVGNTAFDTRKKSMGGIVQSGRLSLSDGTAVPVFTGHSTNYYVGYNEGCAVLESWTSNNPLYVIAQAFVGGETVGNTTLDKSAARAYNGINDGSYFAGFDDATYEATLEKLKADGVIANSDFITNADIPVPTLFAGYGDDDASVTYWKGVNDVEDAAQDGVFYQRLDSDAWQSLYANANAKNWGEEHGISQMKLVDSDSMNASDIHDFLAEFTRYTNPFAYSNALGERLDYYATTEAARTSAEEGKALSSHTFQGYDGNEATVELRALESTKVEGLGGDKGSGTVYSCIMAFNDYDSDGTLDPRETLMYFPDSAKQAGDAGVPVVVVFPGNTQSAATFTDCSQWWAIANDEGCAVIVMGEYCAKSAAGLTYGDTADSANFSRAAVLLMEDVVSGKADVKIDTTRVYGSGHSLGSRTIQTLTHNSEAATYAAVASTSFHNEEFTATGGMPSYLMVGQADLPFLQKDPWSPPEAGEAPAQGETIQDGAVYNWVKGAQKANGLDVSFVDNDKASFLAACSSYSEAGRYYTYTWNDASDAPLVQFTRTLAREHNCYPEEFKLAWDFLKHYSVGEDGARYYSPSAFAEDDKVAILK